MKAYVGQLNRRKAELARFLALPDTCGDVTRRTIETLKADIARLAALAAQGDSK